MRIRDVFREHPDEWVALLVRRTDPADVPIAGDVIAHAHRCEELDQQARTYRATHPEARLFIFFAGEPIPEGLAVSLGAR